MKVVKNCCYGGFGFSQIACEWFRTKRGLTEDNISDLIHGRPDWTTARTSQDLIDAVDVFGEDVDSCYSKLRIVEVPCEKIEILDYDGAEWIVEDGRVW